MAVRTVTNNPMNKVDEWSCSDDGSVLVRLSASKKDTVTIEAAQDNNVLITMRRKSERSCTGIDRNRFASVELSTKTNPMYIIAGVFALGWAVFFWFFEGIAASILTIVGVLLIVAYFLSKIARLNIRVAEDVDYRILLKASAVPSPQEMKMLVGALMMTSPLTEQTQSNHAHLVVSQTPVLFQSVGEDSVDENGVAWSRQTDGTYMSKQPGSNEWLPFGQ